MSLNQNRPPRTFWLRYLVAVLLTLLALALTALFWPLVDTSPFIFFVAAVTLSAWYGRLGPGLLATVLSIGLADYFLSQPLRLPFTGASDYAQLTIFASVAFLISWTENHRRVAEDDLRQTRDQLQAILNGVSDAITAQDETGKIVFANDFAALQSGFSSANAMMHTPITRIRQRYDLYDLDGKPLSHDALPRYQVFRTGRSASLKFQQYFRDTEETKWIHLKTSPIKDSNGKVRLVVNIFRDVSLRHRIESLQKANLRFVWQLLDSLPILVGVMSPDGKLVTANKMALELAGLGTDDVIGKPFDSTYWWSYSPESQDRLRTMIARALAGETVRHDVKIRVGPDDFRMIDFMIKAMRDENGEITHLVPAAVDITERREREDKIIKLTQNLQIEKRRLNTIIANIPGIVFEAEGPPHTDGQRMSFVSDYIKEMLGYAPEDWLENPSLVSGSIHPDDLVQTLQQITNVYDRDNSGIAQFRMITHDKNIIHAEARTSVLKDGRGNPIGSCGVIMDVTARKRDEVKLAQMAAVIEAQHKRLANVVANVPGIVFDTLIDPTSGTHRSMFMSDYTETMLGYTPDYWEDNKDFWRERVVHPEDWENLQKDLEIITRNSGSGTLRFRCIRKDETVIHVEANVTFLQQGDKWRSYGVLMDITERKRDEDKIQCLTDELRTQRDRLDRIVSNVPGIVFEVAGDLRKGEQHVVYLSDYAEKLLGYPMIRMVSSPNVFREVIHPDDAARAQADSLEIYSTQRIGTVQYRAITSSGSILHLESHESVVTDAHDQPIGAMGVVMDVTERKKIEQRLKRYMMELHRSNQELEQFAYVASHDLQEPLRKIKSYLQLIEKRYQPQLDDDGREFIGYAVDGANRMRVLINDLLTYSRVQRNQGEFRSTALDAVLDHVLNTLQLQIDDAQATITYDPLPTIHADESQIIQLFQNLLSNAMKYRREGVEPIVHIGVQDRGSDWCFSVSDNGIGIQADQFEQIFVVFQRLHHRDAYPGTGIGLAIAKRVVTNHRGQIWLESTLEEGTTFYFTLPKSSQNTNLLAEHDYESYTDSIS